MDPCSCNVELCVNNRDGTKQLYMQPAGKNESKSDLKTLVSSLQKIQTEVNSHLTVIVEKEKARAVSIDNSIKTSANENDTDEELEEDEGEEDDETNGQPVKKKIKR